MALARGHPKPHTRDHATAERNRCRFPRGRDRELAHAVGRGGDLRPGNRDETLRARTNRTADRASSGAPRALSEPGSSRCRGGSIGPIWVDVPDLDVEDHLRHARLDAPEEHAQARDVGGSHLLGQARSGPPALAAVVCRRPARRERGTRLQDPPCARRRGPRRVPLRRDLRFGARRSAGATSSQSVGPRCPTVDARAPRPGRAVARSDSAPSRSVPRETSVVPHRGWRGSRAPRNAATRSSRSRRPAVPTTESSRLDASSRSVRWNSRTSGRSRTPSV